MTHNRFLILSTCIILAGCSGNVRESLGLTKESPDEFMVLSRPELSVPPDFRLSSPETAYSHKTRDKTRNEAKSILLTNTEEKTDSIDASSAELTLLKKADAEDVTSDIRDILQKETVIPEKDDGVFEKLRKAQKLDPIVDADAEKERIIAQQAEGKPLNEGKTPTIEPADDGVIGQIFN